MKTREARPIAALVAALTLTLAPAATAPQASAGESTKQVQWDLAGLGYLPMSGVDGIPGPDTARAIRAFQDDQCLAVDGIVGPRTEDSLDDTVMAVQAVAGVTPDGDYGPRTKAAVATWQGSHHLGADGIAGKATMGQMSVTRERTCGTPTGVPAPGTSAAAALQWNLAGLGYLPWREIDGVVGPRTQAATQALQADRCVAVDGIAGPVTTKAVTSLVKQVQAKVGATQDGSFDTATKTATAAWQRGHGLAADGQVGPDTMKAMGVVRDLPCGAPAPDPKPGPRPTPTPPPAGQLGTKIGQIAKARLADKATNRESGGYNCNWYSTQWGRNAEGGKGPCEAPHPDWLREEWCADFAEWVWREAGAQIGGINAAAASFGDFGKARGTLHKTNPKVGDAVVHNLRFDNRGRGVAKHVEIVVAVTGDTVTTIGGNDGPDTNKVHQDTLSFPQDDISFVSPIPTA